LVKKKDEEEEKKKKEEEGGREGGGGVEEEGGGEKDRANTRREAYPMIKETIICAAHNKLLHTSVPENV
jgi:hypothetical protein